MALLVAVFGTGYNLAWQMTLAIGHGYVPASVAIYTAAAVAIVTGVSLYILISIRVGHPVFTRWVRG